MRPKTVHNLNAGPAVLPTPALERAHAEFFDFAGTGMSVLEVSHRSPEFEGFLAETEKLVRKLAKLPANFKVLFLQGGASLQFGMIPMNLLKGGTADYLVTGVWAEKAYKEAKHFGSPRVAASTADTNHDHIPGQAELKLNPGAAYVHYTTNNTIYGTQFHYVPNTGATPLIADMSSDIFSRRLDLSRFGLIYAGAQKNIGPAGITLVLLREDLLARCAEGLTTMLSYRTHAENNSLFNTIPVFAVYMLHHVLRWMSEEGGLDAIEKRNIEKAGLLYDVIDKHAGFYLPHARKDSRSLMNVTFRLPSPELEKTFLTEAGKHRIVGVRGHRLVGGCRASLYNALPLESARAVAQFMEEFARRNG